MQSNEFYCVEFEEGNTFGEMRFFKNKDNAYNYLWQSFLNKHGDLDDRYIETARNELNNDMMIVCFGYIHVLGFED